MKKLKTRIEVCYRKGIEIETVVLDERKRFGRDEILIKDIKLEKALWITKTK